MDDLNTQSKRQETLPLRRAPARRPSKWRRAGWILLGETLTWLQILGGVSILAGIVCVKLERPVAGEPSAIELGAEPLPVTASVPVAPAPPTGPVADVAGPA